MLQSLCDGEQDKDNPNLIRVNATKAYELALKKYHGWMLQKLFLVSPRGADGASGRDPTCLGRLGGYLGEGGNTLDLPFFKGFGGLLALARGWGGRQKSQSCRRLTRFPPQGSVYALPYKSDLLKALEKGREVKQEETLEKIHLFLSKATPILDTIYEMYTKMNAELNYKA